MISELEADVRHLAETIGERNMETEGSMAETTDWICSRMQEAGYRPERHSYILGAPAISAQSDLAADNIIAEIPGTSPGATSPKSSASSPGVPADAPENLADASSDAPKTPVDAPDAAAEASSTNTKHHVDPPATSPGEIVIIGAHYDSVPLSPGANDNASALAVLLAMATRLRTWKPRRTIRLVAFANEEPPYFLTSDMGSYAYAARCKERGEQIAAMIALDGVGCFSDEPGSQQYPVPGLGLRYPDKGDFIGMVTRLHDRKLLRRVLQTFRNHAQIPAEGAALPSWVPGVYWSDHWSFWQHEYPALLVTDTLPYRDPHYHTPADTADRLDFARMAQVADGLVAVVKSLSG